MLVSLKGSFSQNVKFHQFHIHPSSIEAFVTFSILHKCSGFSLRERFPPYTSVGEANGGHALKRKNNRRQTRHVFMLLMWRHPSVQSNLTAVNISAAPVSEARVDVLAKNMVLTLPF